MMLWERVCYLIRRAASMEPGGVLDLKFASLYYEGAKECNVRVERPKGKGHVTYIHVDGPTGMRTSAVDVRGNYAGYTLAHELLQLNFVYAGVVQDFEATGPKEK